MQGRGRRFADPLLSTQRLKAARCQLRRASYGQGFEKAYIQILFTAGSAIRLVLLHATYSSECGAHMVVCCTAGRDRTNERSAFTKSAYSCHSLNLLFTKPSIAYSLAGKVRNPLICLSRTSNCGIEEHYSFHDAAQDFALIAQLKKALTSGNYDANSDEAVSCSKTAPPSAGSRSFQSQCIGSVEEC